jgi:DNA-binding MarR family transcriptional regulator
MASVWKEMPEPPWLPREAVLTCDHASGLRVAARAVDRFSPVPGTEPSVVASAATRSPHVSYVVARLERALRKEIGRLVGPRGLSVAQYTTLSILRSRSGLSNAQLARRLWVTPQSMNEVISALERAGLIERVPDAANRRILRTALTPNGRATLEACDADILAMEQEMLTAVPGEDHDNLVATLENCVSRIGVMSDERRTDGIA